MIAAAGVGCLLTLQKTADIKRLSLSVRPIPETREFFAHCSLKPDDFLFVWGTRPELYCLSGLLPASEERVASGVFKSFWRRRELDDVAARSVMAELNARPPRFIVTGLDAIERNGTGGYFSLRFFPALAEFVAARYHLAARLSECDIYERNAPNDSPTSR